MKTSMFAFSVAAPRVKGDASSEPELMVVATKDKFRLNSALTRKLLLQAGDRLMFITNEDALLEAVAAGEITEQEVADNLMFAIAKGVPEVDANGKVKIARRRLTKAEEELLAEGKLECELDEEGRPIETAYHGFKLASNQNATGYGMILEGSDASQWKPLGGTTEHHRVYRLGEEIEVPVGATTVKAYIIEFDRIENKIERTKSNAANGAASQGSDFDSEEELD